MCALRGCHPGPMFNEADRQAAAERVAVKRQVRKALMASGTPPWVIREVVK